MSPWEKLLERPHSRGHVVQLYEQADELSLAANVSRCMAGWQRDWASFESVMGAALARARRRCLQ